MHFAPEYDHWKSVVTGLTKPSVPIERYIPMRRQRPPRDLAVVSAWEGIPSILADIIQRFRLKTELCLEFGVEYGFSTVALSSFFDNVIGVDTFQGDKHTNNKLNIFDTTQKNSRHIQTSPLYVATTAISFGTRIVNSTSFTLTSFTHLPTPTPVGFGARSIPVAPSSTIPNRFLR